MAQRNPIAIQRGGESKFVLLTTAVYYIKGVLSIGHYCARAEQKRRSANVAAFASAESILSVSHR